VPRTTGKRIQVRRSGVHGKGVFALQDIAEGDTVIEYVGEIISWDEAQDRHPHNPEDPNHTFYFHVNEDRVIDALNGGNSSRWINHSCDPNCEADEDNDRIFIKAIRDIAAPVGVAATTAGALCSRPNAARPRPKSQLRRKSQREASEPLDAHDTLACRNDLGTDFSPAARLHGRGPARIGFEQQRAHAPRSGGSSGIHLVGG
jgi:hypothetical protein